MAAPAEVRIVLLGKTGSGKSSTGNVILGEEKFGVSGDSNSVTIDCQTEEGNLNYRKITITDTPGIFDPERSDKDLKYSILSCLTECAPGPHAFILVLTVGRYTKEEKVSVKMILKWFGKEALKHTVVLFTYGDELQKNQTIKKYAERNKDLKELIDKCGGRVHVIDSQQWNKEDDKNAQSADLVEQLKKMMIEKSEAGESQAVQTLEEMKNWLLEQRSSTSHQEPDKGSGRPTSSDGDLDKSEYRSNSFQIKQLLTTIENMVTNNGSSHYTNKSLQVIADGIEMEVKKTKEEMMERGEKAEESEIRKRARERVRTKTMRLVSGVTTGALLGALLGVTVGISIPLILAGGLLVGAVAKEDAKTAVKSASVACAKAGAVGALAAAGAAGAEAGAVGTLGAGAVGAEAGAVGALGAGSAVAIGVGIAAGGLAAAGAIGGGVEGARAAARADTPKEAAENAAEAVVERAGKITKEAWELGQIMRKAKQIQYKKL